MTSRFRYRSVGVAATVAMTAAMLAFVGAAPAAAANPVQATLFASPGGSTTSDCTSSTPCTLERARAKVRTLTGIRTGDVVVQLAGGTYELESTFQLTGEDSGRDGFSVIYRAAPGQKPILSGGEHLTGTGFTYDSATGIYSKSIPKVESRQLYVDGVRATRARGPELPATFVSTTTGYPLPADPAYAGMASWAREGDIEAVADRSWKRSRYSVDTITTSGIDMDDQGWLDADLHYPAKNSNIHFENALELLDEPGEWYLDRTADPDAATNYTLHYKPLAGQTVDAGLQLVLGTTHQLLVGAGTAESPVHHVQFDGLTFSYDGWTQPNTPQGYPDFQGGNVLNGRNGDWTVTNVQTPAGVSFTEAHDIVVRNSTFTHMANAALAFGKGAKDSTVINNSFSDISGNGINVGGIMKSDHDDSAATMVQGITVANNVITKIGVEYHDNVGIFLGFTRNVTVTHNTIHDLPYTGISFGFGWGAIDWHYPNHSVGGNTISYNLIHDVMQTNHDGGAIYSLGQQPGSTVVGNYMFGDMANYGYLYRDNGTDNVVDSNNVIDGIGGGTNNWYYTNTDYNGSASEPWYSTDNNKAENNWFTAGMTTYKVGYTNTAVMTGDKANVAITNNNWPAAAKLIMKTAGAPISVGKAATASSEYASAIDEWDAFRAVDGDTTTRWAQAGGAADPSSLTVDLGSNHLVTAVKTDAYLLHNDPVKYKIEYAVTANTWLPYVEHTTEVVPGIDYTDQPVVARWMRITFTDTQYDSGLQGGSIKEFTVYGDASLPDRPLPVSSATASSEYSSGYSAAKAVDFDPSTRWAQAAGTGDPSWLVVDLGTSRTVTRVKTSAYLHSSDPVAYRIEYAVAANTWLPYAEHTTPLIPGFDSTGTTVDARWLRVTFTDTNFDSSGLQGGSIWEFTVFGR